MGYAPELHRYQICVPFRIPSQLIAAYNILLRYDIRLHYYNYIPIMPIIQIFFKSNQHSFAKSLKKSPESTMQPAVYI